MTIGQWWREYRGGDWIQVGKRWERVPSGCLSVHKRVLDTTEYWGDWEPLRQMLNSIGIRLLLTASRLVTAWRWLCRSGKP